MNEVIKAMHERRSVRRYKAEMPDDELIAQVADAGLWAANGRGSQSTELIVVKDRQLRDEMSRLNCQVGGWKEDFDPFYGAPVIIAVLDKRDGPSCVYDGSLAIGNMMLAAHSLGLSTCWIHRAKEVFALPEGRKILEKLGLNPDEWTGVGHLALGYAASDAPKPASRKDGRLITVD